MKYKEINDLSEKQYETLQKELARLVMPTLRAVATVADRNEVDANETFLMFIMITENFAKTKDLNNDFKISLTETMQMIKKFMSMFRGEEK
jgi:hypothetical protein